MANLDFSALDFPGYLSVALFTALSMCYFLQWWLAGGRAGEPQEDNTDVTLADIVRHHDDGYRDVWAFFVLTIFSPVLLTAIGNMIPLITETDTLYEPSDAAVYFLCLAVIGVLITLELSYVYQFRRSATGWIPLLAASVALDILTLLVLFSFVRNPVLWEAPIDSPMSTEPNKAILHWATKLFMAITTGFAFWSSFWILVYTRTAGALRDRLVEIDTVAAAREAARKLEEAARLERAQRSESRSPPGYPNGGTGRGGGDPGPRRARPLGLFP